VSWAHADELRDVVVGELQLIRSLYATARLKPSVKEARLIAIDRKIDALNAVTLDGSAYPWCEDGVGA
jgi:hypothetical protein